MKRILPIFLFVITLSPAQITSFPYNESFDSVTTPTLPLGWTTTTNRLPGGDFITSTTTVRSSPNCVSSTNGRISQSIITPVFDFTAKFPDSLIFYERRTSTHTSPLLLEASINGDTTFSIPISDTLKLQSSTAYVKRGFAIPETLNGKPNVSFRWRVVADSTAGTSGVIRFDDITVTVKKAVDLSISSFVVSPVVPKKGEAVIASITLRNRALTGNFSGTVQLFDSLTLVASQNFSQSFAENESLTVQLNYPNITAGRHPLIAKIVLSGDEDTTNNSLSVVVNAGYQPSTMLINEFMYAPPTGMPEWVELVNNSSDTIQISGWRISDAGSTRALIAPDHTIPPTSFFIVTTDTNGFKSYFSDNIPLYHAQFSALNNTGDAVVLFDPTGTVIDTLTFASSWGGSSGGKSLERIDTAVASTLQSNWGTSKHTLGATPGAVNSVTQKAFDVAVSNISISPLFPITGNPIIISSVIRNVGKQNLSSLLFQLYLDENKDSLLAASEIQFQQNIVTVNAGDSVRIDTNLPSLLQGTHWLFAKVSTAQDDDTTNNTFFFPIVVGLLSQSVVINEIMYAPTGDQPEWIELHNRSAQQISLSGWMVSDAGAVRAPIQQPEASIAGNGYAIIATDSTVFKNYFPNAAPVYEARFSALNNTTSDAVVLFDDRGATMDSVSYKPNWGGTNGASLQRFDTGGNSVDSANWKPALPTPGAMNASVKKNVDARVRRIHISPPLPITGQQVTVSATIENSGRQIINNVTVEFYHDINNDSVASSGELKSQHVISTIAANDSTIVATQFALPQSGAQKIFVKLMLIGDEETTNNMGVVSISVGVVPQSIVVTEIMYNPQDEIPEWVEFLNNSGTAVSIAGWKISDNGTTKTTIVNNAVSVPSQSYFIVTTDTSFGNYYPIPVPLFVAPFSSLNNTTPDAVVLFDERGGTIDSVYYRPAWGGSNGNSLQRFDIVGSSSDSANWRSEMPSAGLENTIARKDFDVEVKNIQPVKIANGTRVQTTILNSGRQSANTLSVKFYHDGNSDSAPQQDELIGATDVSLIAPADSIAVGFDWIHALQGRQYVIVTIEFSQDQRLTNNVGFTTTVNSFSPQSIVINEVMYEPLPDNAEFVELFNRSADSIDIFGWKLMDQPSSTGSRAVIQFSQEKRIVPPNGYVVIASDSSIFTQFTPLAGKFVIVNSSLSLSNGGEDLVLADLTDTQIDSVRYSRSWHLKNISTAGRSLERINPNTNGNDGRNWSSSVAKNGASPMQTNSIYIASASAHSGLTLTPNPFSPDNDGFEDFLSINYTLPTNSATIRVRIYDVTGRLIRRLAQSEPSPSSGSIIWNGLDDDGHRVRIGMYIILFEAFDNFGGTVKTIKDVAVVARKL